MVLFYMDDRTLSIQPEKDEQYGQKSKMKAFFRCFNFDMGNVGYTGSFVPLLYHSFDFSSAIFPLADGNKYSNNRPVAVIPRCWYAAIPARRDQCKVRIISAPQPA
jgi:hypothetical protein